MQPTRIGNRVLTPHVSPWQVQERAKTQTPVISSSVDVWGSFLIPLDKPREKYASDTRGLEDDLEDLEEEEEEGLLDFTDEATDGAELEGWDEAEMEDAEALEEDDWEDDADIWAGYEPPVGKGNAD
jgi:hypothetical protein